MRAKGRQLTAVTMVVLLLGVHWGLLQAVAWTGMLVSRVPSMPLREAVSTTFDGEHPCALCQAVREGRADEKQQDPQQMDPGPKLEIGLVWDPVQFEFATSAPEVPCPDRRGPTRREQPPKPPPRSSLDAPAGA